MAAVVSARDTSPFLVQSDKSEVFICEICSKTFPKRPSRNRHRLYCRKKSALGQPHRKRPCVSCRQAKIKCNAAFPTCNRCVEKKLACVYHGETPKAPLVLVLCTEDVSIIGTSDSQLGVSPAFGGAAVGTYTPAPLDSASNIRAPVAESPSEDWNFGSPTYFEEANAKSPRSNECTSLATLTSDPTSDDLTFDFSPRPSTLHFEGNLLLETYSLETDFSFSAAVTLNTEVLELSGAFFDSPYLKLRYMTSLHHSASQSSTVIRRDPPFLKKSRDKGSQVGQGFILQNIRSYTNMMLKPTSSPPFIHRSALAGTGGDSDSPNYELSESLAGCQTIVQMHSTRTKQMSAFLWRTMASEQQRLAGTHREANECNTLAMLQAMTIYILLRIFSEDSFSNEFDNDLIQTMTAIAIQSEGSGFLSTSEVLYEMPTWSEWILMESKRRTVTLLFIIHLLFDINPGQRAKACSGLSQLPLPAYKEIWEARTEFEWTAQYQTWLRGREGRCALSYGDMLFLSQSGHNTESDPRLKDLNVWYVNVDAFGILVMIAATSLQL